MILRGVCFMSFLTSLGLIIICIAYAVVLFMLFARFFAYINHKLNIDHNKNVNTDTVAYIPKKFLSNNEYNFLTKFIDLENELHVNIVPQVNLASIIEKRSDSRFNTELFRNIDYGIFSADYSKILLLIEFNDESHNSYNRKKRDMKVRDICNKAGIKLITFYTKYSNEKEYVKSRIIKELNMTDNSD